MKTQAQTLYEMAAEIRRRGFSPTLKECGPTCFLGIQMLIGCESLRGSPLLDVIGTGWRTAPFRDDVLRAVGWTEGSTEDAAAACEIAGDIAFEQERRR